MGSLIMSRDRATPNNFKESFGIRKSANSQRTRINSNEIQACVDILNKQRMAENIVQNQKHQPMEASGNWNATQKSGKIWESGSETVNINPGMEENPRTEYWDKRKSRYPRKDSWKRNGSQSGYGGNGNKQGKNRRFENRRKFTNSAGNETGEEVIQREDKPIIFDLSSGRSKMELNDWFKNNAPSKICKSDGVGWIYILSENISEKEKRKLFESDGGIFALRQEWPKSMKIPIMKLLLTLSRIWQKNMIVNMENGPSIP